MPSSLIIPTKLLAEQVKVYHKQYKMLAALGYDDVPAALEEVAYALDDLHAVGFGLNTHNETIYLGNDCLNPIFEELNRRSALVFLHPCHNRAPATRNCCSRVMIQYMNTHIMFALANLILADRPCLAA